MALEEDDYEFMYEQELRDYIKTLQGIRHRNFAPIQCGQGSRENLKEVYACNHAVNLIKGELAEMEKKKKGIIQGT